MARNKGGWWSRSRYLGECGTDVPRYHPLRSSWPSTLHGRDGADQPFGRITDIAGLSEALAAERRVACRCGGDELDCSGMAGGAAIELVSAAAASNSSFPDRKSTRLKSSHQIISYVVFCL